MTDEQITILHLVRELLAEVRGLRADLAGPLDFFQNRPAPRVRANSPANLTELQEENRRELMRIGVRDPALTKWTRQGNPDTILAWEQYCIDTDMARGYRPGYIVKRLEEGAEPPSSFEVLQAKYHAWDQG